MSGDAIGLRERTRRAVQTELMDVAMGLFLDQGFEATTVEQIATRAGLSRRSFFRYFDSKDAVLSDSLATAGAAIAGALRSRPADEPNWTALRRAFDPLVAAIKTEPRALAMTKVMLESPALRPGHERKQSDWTHAISVALIPRLGRDTSTARLTATALASSALACLTVAQSAWVESDGRQPLGRLLDSAMSAVASL